MNKYVAFAVNYFNVESMRCFQSGYLIAYSQIKFELEL